MPKLSSDQQTLRRATLLDAAERCFVRDGFHRTSMQAIAREAKSSAGALYLYFASKEELIAGLIERDQQSMAHDFGEVALAADPLAALRALAQRLFVEDPPSRWQLTVQIWAEAGRNATVRALCQSIDRECRRHLGSLLGMIGAQGRVAPDVDIDRLVAMLMLVAAGIFKHRAIDPEFDTRSALAGLLAVLDAGLAGRIHFPPPERSPSVPARDEVIPA